MHQASRHKLSQALGAKLRLLDSNGVPEHLLNSLLCLLITYKKQGNIESDNGFCVYHGRG
jgi:hypothetical protein